METFISVDVETSGRRPGHHDLLALGACRADRPETGFKRFLKPWTGRFEPEAMKVNGLDLDWLRANGEPLADAIRDFHDWACSESEGGTPVFVGLNAPFDWAFVSTAFDFVGVANPFHFVPLDIKALYMGATRCSWDETRSSRMHARLSPTLSPDHADPLVDARYQAELFRAILDLPFSGTALAPAAR